MVSATRMVMEKSSYLIHLKFRGKEEQYSREDGFIDHRDSSCYSFMPDSFGIIMFMEGNQYPIAGFLHLT